MTNETVCDINLQRFVVIFPAYKEDAVILDSVRRFLKQDYPIDKYKIVVVSDKMQDETNHILSELPIDLFVVNFEVSLKSKAIKYALDRLCDFDKAVILDADNITDTDFLTRVNRLSVHTKAMQLHRTRKNSNTAVAVLDGIAEEINNTIYRKGHVNVGLSSAIIGSGIVFDFEWLKHNIGKCETFAEDKELEVLLAKDDIFVDYENDVYVYDEKTATKDIFLIQRMRWAHSQTVVFSLLIRAMKNGVFNITTIDKLFQWIPFPKQIRMLMAFLSALIWSFVSFPISIKWWFLLLFEILVFALAIPQKMYNSSLYLSLMKLPVLIVVSIKSYLKAFVRMYRKDMSFNSTPHQSSSADD
ncbi:glycosyltransferase [Coprobacter tertius]|uniref:Glycosyltransferase family 2 protein n=1 Tax=Coprobacter tertius TaxID=2944915 RepID=A0ABT1MI93_9BACT|nr:glycosyltransferase family 2 protein [Coprobacter tertius]